MYAVFARPVVWYGTVRAVIFLGLATVSGLLLARVIPFANAGILAEVSQEMARGTYERVSDRTFAFALASLVVQIAGALAISFFVAHVILIRVALADARGVLRRAGDTRAVAESFDVLRERLERNALIGSAWGEFSETLVLEPRAIRNTIRPQSFINIGVARERLYGLKMMSSVPGYFVGLGLLLTFIGLVFALNKAAASTSAGSAEEMTRSLSELLSAATFKFGTSIAGLGSSLVLALLFKSYAIWIEVGFDGLCRDLEDRLVYYPPQAIAAETKIILEAQRDQLKEINSERFFTRLGDTVAPSIQSAMAAAVQPMTESLQAAVSQVTQTSQNGLDEMLLRFQDNLQSNAGAELRQLAGTLQAMQGVLEGVQHNLSGSGQDFARQLSDAASNLDRLVAQAGANLGASADTSRALLEDVARELRAAFEMANRQVTDNLAASTRGAAGLVEEAMGRVLERLEGQTTAFGQTIAALQATIADGVTGSARSAQIASERASSTTQEAAETAAAAMRNTIGEVTASVAGSAMQSERLMEQMTTRLNAQMTAMTSAMEMLQRSLAAQAEDNARTAREAGAAAAQGATHAAQEAARAMQGTVGDVSNSVRASAAQAEDLMAQMAMRMDTQMSALVDLVGTLRQTVEAQAQDSARAVRDAEAAATQSAVNSAEAAARVMAGTVDDVSRSVSGAAAEAERSLSGIAAQLGTQLASFNETVAGLQRTAAANAEDTARVAREASSAATASATLAAREAAEAMRATLSAVTAEMHGAVESLSGTLRTVETAFAGQVRHVDGVAARSKETADAFAQASRAIQGASQPLLQTSERIAGAAETMANSVHESAGALRTGQTAAIALAERLERHLEQAGQSLEAYEQRFANVDAELGQAVGRFAEQVRQQQDRVGEFVVEIDRHLSGTTDKLARMVDDLASSNEELAAALATLAHPVRLAAAE